MADGSNACVFIALHLGMLIQSDGLTLTAQDQELPITWKKAAIMSMREGNRIHDSLFDEDAVNVNVHEAFDLSGKDLGLHSVGPEVPMFGSLVKAELVQYLTQTGRCRGNAYNVIVTSGRAMLFVTLVDNSIIFFDSHSHVNGGAVISFSEPGEVHNFVEWLDNLMMKNWNTPITICTITRVFYK